MQVYNMEKQTTENETLNAKLRNKVTPLVTLLDILDAIDDGTFTTEQMESVNKILKSTMIHSFIDNQKANKKTINLITDQTLHLIQIILIFIVIPT